MAMRRLAAPTLLGLFGLSTLACGPDEVSAGDDESGDAYSLVQVIETSGNKRVDMILVVDDSPSMRGFAEPWAANVEALAEIIEAEDVEADVRIAVTTTSVPGPTCAGERAIGGEPTLQTCRAHLEDFVGADEHGEHGGGVEDLAASCEQLCSLDELPVRPSFGAAEHHEPDDLALRPWIEADNNPFGGNLDGVELREALACVAMPGFAGCRHESPLEAAARMVEHMNEPGHPMAEFRRPEAGLSIITFGDEDDCSHPASSATIFDPEGERIFWPDPNAAEAPSAVCSNAGLDCDDQGCTLTDHTIDGSPTQDPSAAVLTPTSRLRNALAAAGEYDDPDFEPVLANVGGYRDDGSVNYTPATPETIGDNQDFLDSFGVLPGCQSPQPAPALPLRAEPGGRRAAAAAEVGSPGGDFSICNADWSPVLEHIAAQILDQIRPACIDFACVDDLEPSSALLAPDCVLEQVDWDETRTELPPCQRDDQGWVIDPETNDYTPPAGEDRCWVWLTDAEGLTSDPYDDMSAECVDNETVGEIKIARRPGANSYMPYDSHVELRCRPCGG